MHTYIHFSLILKTPEIFALPLPILFLHLETQFHMEWIFISLQPGLNKMAFYFTQ